MKPTELDLNLDGLRTTALRDMIEAVRTALQKCDDIEAMARVLHSQAATTIKAKVHSESNGNGHAPLQLKPARKQRSTPVYIDRENLLASALVLIDKAGPEGINSKQLESYLRANGVVPRAVSLQGARVAINDVLRPLPTSGRIRKKRITGVNGAIYYWPGTTRGTPLAQLPTKDEEVLNGAGHTGRTERLRNFLVTTLAKQTSPMPVSEMQRIAIEEAGFTAQWGKGDTLRNQVGRLLRLMLASGQVKRFGNGKHGGGGVPFTYVIVRPKISVSKH